MTPLDSVLVRCALQVAVFSLAMLAMYAVARRLGARAAVAALLWGMVLTLGLTLLAGSPWPRWELTAKPDNSVGAMPLAAAAEQPTAADVGEDPPQDFAPPTLQQFTLSDYAREFTTALTEQQPINPTRNSQWSWLVLAAIAGAVFSLLRLAVGLVSVRRLSRGSSAIEDEELLAELGRLRDDLAVDARVAVRESHSLSTPATIGWRRPQILLPAGWQKWSSDELRAVLAHELAHIAGRDYLGWVVARLAVAVHFYNPLVRWLAARLQLEQELAADAAAARLTGGSQQYLQTLAALALATPPQRVAGPARTLFPTRSLLMRRVEMLRSPLATLNGRPAAGLKWTAAATLALVAVGVAGLRPPAGVAEEPAVYDVVDLNNSEPIPLTLAPKDSMVVLSVNVARVAHEPEMARLLESDAVRDRFRDVNLSLNEISEILLAVPSTGRHAPRLAIRTLNTEALKKVTAALSHLGFEEESRETRRAWRNNVAQVVLLDDTTLVCDYTVNQAPPLENPVPACAAAWGDEPAALNLWIDNQQVLATGLRQEMQENRQAALIAPTLEKIQRITGSLSIDENARLQLTAETDSEDSAKQVVAMLDAMRVLGQNAIQQPFAAVPDEQRAMYDQAVSVLGSALAGLEIKADGADARVVYQPDESVAEIGELASTLLPAVTAARVAARRSQSANNLKQLGLAMLNYESTYGHYPAALNYEYVDPETNEKKRSPHPHSWRVAILPFLDEQALYDLYRFDEPWDSEANMKIANTLVPVMIDPSATTSDYASYFVPVGKQTMFPGEQAVRIREVTDGTSKTILIVEAKRDIPWTKPEDIEIPADGPLPEFGGHYNGFFLRALADGSVRDTPTDTDPKLLRAMLTRNGEEVFNWPDVYPDLREE
ncbi:Regulatory protein BlaR1 [Posidoniimonas polymericola]|uniref:Regulatory protein BlaR1 n=1 Tax=Posidoniimonas polymericola TaxID=2528002 RepID=A0A5C5ZDD5_9BACT|nr:M56 family metallopeptidase [Posidoniimonas polymericola]TWT85429.1 Regulatory protein BlaR1 [Posidoniimonas polymericola]